TRRVAAATEGLVGVAALRTYCVEFMPLSDTTDDEARVIIPFWHHALTDPDLARRHEQAMAIWRRDLRRHVRAGIERGEITAEVDAARLIELILTTLHGSQITATVTATPRRSLERQLDDLLHLLTPQA
ncbi:MAG TPA: TetR family transcriptional regulator C-terminal domain-containing protein, partial [Acidimicrobiales bacterium]|nr:TetR family transcriptional regulator C-terminal domain-containing protein [Acidimicrobiales bacterium]